MKAIVYTRYGPPDVLQFREVEKPEPADDEVLVKVHAASVNPFDWHLMRGEPFPVRLAIGGLLAPKRTILGSDIAGRVEAIGKRIGELRPGDEVFGGVGLGGFAEYVCVSETKLVLKPANLSFEQAAAVPIAAITALQGLRDKGRIEAGKKVLVDGASGGVGTFAIQIAKAFGANVTAVCSTGNMDRARSIGADRVIDYAREDFTRSGQRYDLILAANAYRSNLDYCRALSREGICVKTGGRVDFQAFLVGLLHSWMLPLIGGKRMRGLIAKMKNEDLRFLKDLLEAGKVVPVIDRRYRLGEMAEAIRYLEEGHAQGKVVITIEA